MRANSLFRALRVDKLTYAALESTLLAYVKGDYDAIPALRMMRLTRKKQIGARAETMAQAGCKIRELTVGSHRWRIRDRRRSRAVFHLADSPSGGSRARA